MDEQGNRGALQYSSEEIRSNEKFVRVAMEEETSIDERRQIGLLQYAPMELRSIESSCSPQSQFGLVFLAAVRHPSRVRRLHAASSLIMPTSDSTTRAQNGIGLPLPLQYHVSTLESSADSSPSVCSNLIKSSLAPGIELAARRSVASALSRTAEVAVPVSSLHSSHLSSSRTAHSDTNGALCAMPSSTTAENVARLWSEGEPLRSTSLNRVSTMVTGCASAKPRLATRCANANLRVPRTKTEGGD